MLLTKPIDNIDNLTIFCLDGEINEDGNVEIVNVAGERLNIPRFLIETPVDCCAICYLPYEFRGKDRVGNDKITCPQYENHEFRRFLALSKDERFDRKARRNFVKQAKRFARMWEMRITAKLNRVKEKIKSDALFNVKALES